MSRQIKCARCQRTFECHGNDIRACECSKIQLSSQVRKMLAEQYRDCLCLSCLLELEQLTENDSAQ